MARRVLNGTLCGVGSYVSGPGVRALVEEVTGRPPVWLPRLRAWAVQESTLRDVIALAEARGYDIVMTGETLSSAGDRVRSRTAAPLEAGGNDFPPEDDAQGGKSFHLSPTHAPESIESLL